ncbi:MAG: hypothetical protein IKH26_00655 [Bacteroidaceae bacterium]|nr:hypothetical protein [Bacteroidaceae bacterium]
MKNHGLTTDVKIQGRSLIRDNAWNTLCLPFDVNSFEGTPLENAKVNTLSSSSFDDITGTLTLNFGTATSIEAGKPYLIKWTTPGKAIKDPIFLDVTINSQVKNIKTDAVTFCGTFDPVQLKTNDRTMLYIGDYDMLYYPTEDVDVNSFRAYFKLADGITAGDPIDPQSGFVHAFQLNFGDESETSGIENAQWTMDNGQSESWFDLSGRKLSGKPTQKGVYIKNGRKVVIE